MANRALLHQLATAVLANFKQLVKDKPVRNSSDRQPAPAVLKMKVRSVREAEALKPHDQASRR